jgi:hypothetical protein
MKTKKTRFPKWGSLAYDYAATESARIRLRKPNKSICLYCYEQALTSKEIKHHPECPVPIEER